MIIKKISSVFGAAASVVIVLHNSINAYFMMAGRVMESPVLPAQILYTTAGIHMVLNLIQIIRHHENDAARYAAFFKKTLLQRISAFAMIPFVICHIFVRAEAIGLIPVLIVHFFILVFGFMHVAVSFPNALVTLGIVDNTKQYRKVQLITIIVCIAAPVLGLTASITEIIAM